MSYGTPFVSRAGWGARPRICVSTNIAPEGITVHYGGPSPWGTGVDRSTAEAFRLSVDHNRCASILRAYQAYHLDTQGWCDLAYTSAVCPHGSRFEGRGPGVRTGAQGTNDGNLRSYAVVGLWGSGDPLTEAAKRAFYDEAERLGKPLEWSHLQWKLTSCPGGPTNSWRLAGFPRPAGGTAPPPLPKADDDMVRLVRADGDTAYWIVSHGGKRWVDDIREAKLLVVHAGVIANGRDANGNPVPFVWARSDVAKLPNIPHYRLPAGWT